MHSESSDSAPIASLSHLPRPALVERWQVLYRTKPPKGLSRRFLALAIAYRMQTKRSGGLPPTVQRKLAGTDGSNGTLATGRPKAPVKLAPGTRLIREWNGVTYVVDVADGQFVWNGTRHRSLSAVARAITGARWSGPRFFALKADNKR